MLSLLGWVSGKAQPNDSLSISLLTCSPGTEIYELFGHTGIRVQQFGETPFDIVFNYGMFSFNAPNFVYRFTKGETDYCLGVNDFRDFITAYVMRDSRVDEQILNLTGSQKRALLDALIENARPENRTYRYSFLFDNCATRPRDMISRFVAGRIEYADPRDTISFRQEIDRYAGRYSWFVFGIDLALGEPLDRPATYMQQMFVPMILQQAFESAKVIPEDGRDSYYLVERSVVLYVPDKPLEVELTLPWISPLACSFYLLLLVLLVSLWDVKRKKVTRLFDTVFYSMYGLTGCLLFFLMFISEHPATYPNYSAFWLNPFSLFPAVFIWVKRFKKVVGYYHFANFAVLFVFLLCSPWIPQYFHWAFLPLILASMTRSLSYLAVMSLQDNDWITRNR